MIDKIYDYNYNIDVNEVRRLIEFEKNQDQMVKLKEIINILSKDTSLLEFIKKVKKIQAKQQKSDENSDFYKLIKMRNDELVSKLTINKWNRKIINR